MFYQVNVVFFFFYIFRYSHCCKRFDTQLFYSTIPPFIFIVISDGGNRPVNKLVDEIAAYQHCGESRNQYGEAEYLFIERKLNLDRISRTNAAVRK